MMLLLCTSAFGAAYKWVDENGQVNYSDRPREGAQQIQLSTQRPATPPQPNRAPATPEQTAAPQPPKQLYQRISVSKPSQQATLWNIQGNLDITVELAPALRDGHRVAVTLDGTLVDPRPSGLSFQIGNVFRGVHNLEAVVLDVRGNVLARSAPVTFMVQQTSIQNPQRANPNRAGG
jgi:hypothetical protein